MNHFSDEELREFSLRSKWKSDDELILKKVIEYVEKMEDFFGNTS